MAAGKLFPGGLCAISANIAMACIKPFAGLKTGSSAMLG